MKYEHGYFVINTRQVSCDDCSGHTQHTLECACGWKKDLTGVHYPGIAFVQTTAEFEHLKHRLNELEER